MLPRPLLDDIANGRCLPFIGAGFSLNGELESGKVMLSWQGLADALADDIGIQKRDPLLVITEYEKRTDRPTLIEKIRNFLNIDTIRPGDVHKLFARLSFDTIYTTNFDSLLEDSYKFANSSETSEVNRRPYRVLVGNKEMSHHGGPHVTNIIKMHGDFLHIEKLVLTTKDYDKYIENNEVIKFHLLAMLTIKTPLFLGYSLRDPNFIQIRKIIKEALQDFIRKGYIILFDASPADIAKYEEQDLIVVNLDSRKKSKRQLLLELIQEILDYLSTNSAQRLIHQSEEVIEDEKVESSVKNRNIRYLLEGISETCFIASTVTEESNMVYRKAIRPSIQSFGLQPRRSNELSLGLPIIDEIRTAILQSKLVIVDVTSKPEFVLYELGIAIENHKNVIILSQNEQDIPKNMKSIRSISYNIDALEELQNRLRNLIREILFSEPFVETYDLLRQNDFFSAIMLAYSNLSSVLNKFIYETKDKPPLHNAIKIGLVELRRGEIISDAEYKKLAEGISLRNQIVHYGARHSLEDAQNIVDAMVSISEFVYNNLDALVGWYKYFGFSEKESLVLSFLETLKRLENEFVNSKPRVFLNAREVFKDMGKGGTSIDLIPIIVRVSEAKGKIISRNKGQEISLLRS